MLLKLTYLNPVFLAFLGGLFTWFMTALGSGLVLGFKTVDPKLQNVMLGFASGVMLAASFWSLLDPAIESSAHLGAFKFVPALIGFVLGAVFIWIIDRAIPHIHPDGKEHATKTQQSAMGRTVLLVLSITIHNIPEGLAVGVAFGAVVAGDVSSLMAAMVLALGIGIQNFPEGAAVSIPLRSEGISRKKSFRLGHLSAVVEPISAVLGAALIVFLDPVLPYALSFAAGAMVYVVIEELIPTSREGKGAHLSTMSAIVGFAVMMTLDVALG